MHDNNFLSWKFCDPRLKWANDRKVGLKPTSTFMYCAFRKCDEVYRTVMVQSIVWLHVSKLTDALPAARTEISDGLAEKYTGVVDNRCR